MVGDVFPVEGTRIGAGAQDAGNAGFVSAQGAGGAQQIAFDLDVGLREMSAQGFVHHGSFFRNTAGSVEMDLGRSGQVLAGRSEKGSQQTINFVG